MSKSIPVTPALVKLLKALAPREGEGHHGAVFLSAEQCETARALYAQASSVLPSMLVHEGLVQCPHCGYFEGKLLSKAQAERLGRGRFTLREEGLISWDVAGRLGKGGQLLIHSEADTDCEGENARVQCPLCGGLFLIPQEMEVDTL